MRYINNPVVDPHACLVVQGIYNPYQPMQAHTLRIRLDRAYRKQPDSGLPISLWPYLAVPIRPRLTLLALYDNHTMEEIKGAFPWVKETDVRLTSHRIHEAIALVTSAMEDPTCWVDPGPIPDQEVGDLTDPATPFPVTDRSIPRDTDKQFRQAYYSSAPLMLFGPTVPPELGEISLQRRAVIYLLVVEELRWTQIEELLGCTEWQIREAIRQTFEALEEL